MQYRISFGNIKNHQMQDCYGVAFNSSDPMKEYEHHLETKRMSGADFSDCDYIALYDNDIMVAFDILR